MQRRAGGTCLAQGTVIIEEDRNPPVLPSGKFFSRGGAKFFFKAVRLEAIRNTPGLEATFALRNRLLDLSRGHTTAVVVAEAKAEAVLDLAAQANLSSLIEIELQPIDLLSRSTFRASLSNLRKRVTKLRGYPTVMGYLLDCAVGRDALRIHGLEMLRVRLARVIAAIREIAGSKLVGLKHRADTLGLALPEEDFIYAVAPALTPDELPRSVLRLHNLAEGRPLVIEFGETPPDQDELIAAAFGGGVAGVVAQAPTVDNRKSQHLLHGYLSINKMPRGELLPFLALNGSCPPKPVRTPLVSIVICAFNAERTMRRCLESLRRIDYPNFEVVIVDDGSRDTTAQIAADFPEFRLIRQSNKGLSVARNVGLQAALGELVAYTDSDCVVDPDWLTFMVSALVARGLDGCGGPNYAPHEKGWIEGCVAASPGAPCHVLITDDRAEHLAGCNMLFRKTALENVGGFDPQFTAAGDDVDICWRLMDAGLQLGYCPSAFVWHFRRNTVKTYYGQQRGYGKAEAMLYLKYPSRFNTLGQIKWRGTIPGIARTVPGGGRQRVRWMRSTELLQRVDEIPLSVLRVAPITAEWSLAAAALLVLSLLLGVTIVPAMVALAAGPLWASYYSLRAPLEKCHKGPLSRVLIGWLAYSGSIARTIARYRWRVHARSKSLLDTHVHQRPTIDWKHRGIRLSYWNSVYATREVMLEHLRRTFASIGRAVVDSAGWQDFDLLVEANPWTRIQFRTADEELGGLELKVSVAALLRLSSATLAGLAVCIFASAITFVSGHSLSAAALCIVAVGATIGALGALGESANLAYHAIEQCASELNFVPLGKPVRISSGLSAVEPETREAAQPAGR